MSKMEKLYDIGSAVMFIEEVLIDELKEEGLEEVSSADFMNCKRWFAESFRCPISAEELRRIVARAKNVVLSALKEEGIKNSADAIFTIKNVEYIQDRDTGDYIMRCTIYFEEDKPKTSSMEGKFIIGNCRNLVNTIYADSHEARNECGYSEEDEKCADVQDCPFKQVVERLLKVVSSAACSRCDGCGYDDGCIDSNCGTYAARKCLELLKVEFEED